MQFARLVPELVVSDTAKSLTFYRALGFSVAYDRPEEGFAYLDLNGAQIMLEQAGAHWDVGPLERPYGRGINLQIDVKNVDALLAVLVRMAYPILVPIEERWYRQDDILLGCRQFLVQDPDGYLLRFAENIGERPVPPRM